MPDTAEEALLALAHAGYQKHEAVYGVQGGKVSGGVSPGCQPE